MINGHSSGQMLVKKDMCTTSIWANLDKAQERRHKKTRHKVQVRIKAQG